MLEELIKLYLHNRNNFLRAYFPERMARPMILFVKRQGIKHKIVGCEIGVARGANTKNIITVLGYENIKKLYCVDPFASWECDGRVYDFSSFEAICKKQLRRYMDKIEFIKKKSSDAVEDLPGDLDFVYIDGDHSYKYVFADLMLYYQKLRYGGVIGGDDFSGDYLGVVNAVIDFKNKLGLKLYSKNRDYWLIKEK